MRMFYHAMLCIVLCLNASAVQASEACREVNGILEAAKTHFEQISGAVFKERRNKRYHATSIKLPNAQQCSVMQQASKEKYLVGDGKYSASQYVCSWNVDNIKTATVMGQTLFEAIYPCVQDYYEPSGQLSHFVSNIERGDGYLETTGYGSYSTEIEQIADRSTQTITFAVSVAQVFWSEDQEYEDVEFDLTLTNRETHYSECQWFERKDAKVNPDKYKIDPEEVRKWHEHTGQPKPPLFSRKSFCNK